MHKMLSTRTSSPPEPVNFLTMHEGQVVLKITIQVQTVYCKFVLTLLMWFICSDVSRPPPRKLVTPFGSHFRQTTWGRLSARTFCCTESLLSKVEVAERLQALSLRALPKTNNMAAKKLWGWSWNFKTLSVSISFPIRALVLTYNTFFIDSTLKRISNKLSKIPSFLYLCYFGHIFLDMQPNIWGHSGWWIQNNCKTKKKR